jgi:tetratricopeptide (TPR) repeat protein
MAFSFSIVSTYVTLRQKGYETQRALRIQLTDVLNKIVSLNVENAKLPPDGTLPPGTPPSIKALLNDQRRFLVRQATYIMHQIEPLVSSFEYLLIAATYDNIDDVYQATRYFEIAQQRAEDDINRGIITRSYARFLFNQGEHGRGREQYGEALKIFSGDSDRMKEYRGDTYLRWATLECEWEFQKEAEALFEQAKLSFASKSSPAMRKRSVARLEKHREQLNYSPASKSGSDGQSARELTNGAAARTDSKTRRRRKC